MKFTKEQKEIINEMYNLQLDGSDFGARIGKAFTEVLKPETKKIVVEIEYDQVFSREDMIDFAQYNYEHSSISKVTNLDNWLSERESK